MDPGGTYLSMTFAEVSVLVYRSQRVCMIWRKHSKNYSDGTTVVKQHCLLTLSNLGKIFSRRHFELFS